MGDPYDVGFFETIVGVHFGKPLYLVVILSGGNNSFALGPYPAPTIGSPSVSSHVNEDSVKLLDTFAPPGGANNATNTFLGCFRYNAEVSAQEGWNTAWDDTGGFPAVSGPVNGGCIPSSDPSVTATAEVNFETSATATIAYLYLLTAGDDLLTLNVGVAANSDSGPGPTEVTTNGSGEIFAYVYSTVKGKVTKVLQLHDFLGDGIPRPTEDDSYSVGVTDGGGSFTVNITQDKDPADAQIDNYGKTFQPYKVTLTPNTGMDSIPDQPPIRLG
jgi:hypothetical protein